MAAKLRQRHIRQRGFSLIEVLIASAILAFAVAGIAQSISAGQMRTYAALHDLRGMALVETMMEEIQSLAYLDPEGETVNGPDSGESSRSLFDNCDDFNGYTETLGNCVDASGTAYNNGFTRFSRSVACSYGTISVTGFANPTPGLNVTVTVTDSNALTWTSTRFIPQPLE